MQSLVIPIDHQNTNNAKGNNALHRRSGLTENLSLSLVVRVSLHDEAPASPPAQDGASPHQPQTTPRVGVGARSAVARFPVVHRQSLDWGNHPTSSNFRKLCRLLMPVSPSKPRRPRPEMSRLVARLYLSLSAFSLRMIDSCPAFRLSHTH